MGNPGPSDRLGLGEIHGADAEGQLMATRREACMGLGATAIAGVSWDRTPPLASDEYGAALALLDGHWSWLVDLLSVIRAAEPGEIPDSAAAGLLVRPNGYVAVLNASKGPAFVASLIAHEAWHAYQHSQGRRYYGRAAELVGVGVAGRRYGRSVARQSGRAVVARLDSDVIGRRAAARESGSMNNTCAN